MESLEQHKEDFGSARLFVYGTLRKGFGSHSLLQRWHARFVAPGYVLGRLYDLGEYPGAVETAGNPCRVHGEVYLLPRSTDALEALDRYEGFNAAKPAESLFERKEATVMLATDRQVQAWVYWLRRVRAAARIVPSGNYTLG